MNNLRKWILFAAVILGLIGCKGFTEKLAIQADGSGQYSYHIDMSNLLDKDFLGFIVPLMMQEMGEEIDLGDSENLAEDLMKEITGKNNIDIDSTFQFGSGPDKLTSQFKHPQITSKAELHVKLSLAEEIATAELTLPFKSFGDIDLFWDDVKNMASKTDKADPKMLQALTRGTDLVNMTKNKLIRKPIELKNEELEELRKGEMYSVMKMIFGAANYNLEYEFPGKVKKSTIEGSEISGNKVTASYNLLDVIEGREKLDGMIKFKRK